MTGYELLVTPRYGQPGWQRRGGAVALASPPPPPLLVAHRPPPADGAACSCHGWVRKPRSLAARCGNRGHQRLQEGIADRQSVDGGVVVLLSVRFHARQRLADA